MFDVRVSPAWLTGRNSVTGEIWMEVDGVPFPEERWSDFPVVILSWWLGNVAELDAEVAESVCLEFMDGPYSVVLSRVPGVPDIVDVRCVDRSQPDRSEAETRVSLLEAQEAIRRAADAVIASCRRRRWNGQDVSDLVAARGGEESGPRQADNDE